MNEAGVKACHLPRGDAYAAEFSGQDRLGYGRAKDAVKDFELPVDVVVSGAMANQVRPLCQ